MKYCFIKKKEVRKLNLKIKTSNICSMDMLNANKQVYIYRRSV